MSNIPKMVPYDDSEIVDMEALSKKHTKLVDNLVGSLIQGQTGFIKAGQYLAEIKKSKTYESEDSNEQVTWEQFCSRPDIPLPGITIDARRKAAHRFISIWEDIASRPEIDRERLARIGYTKLALVAGVVNKNPKAKLNDWLDKAETLSTSDLSRAIDQKDKTITEISNCAHDDCEKIVRWKCKNCKETFKEDPSKKDDKKK